jgi:hypothetical protein
MAKQTFKNAKFYKAPNGTAKIFNVAAAADKTGLSPASGDYVYIRATGVTEKYNGSAWASTTEIDYCFTDVTLEETFDTFDMTTSCTSGFNTESATGMNDITLSMSRILTDGTNGLTGKDLAFTYDSAPLAVSNVNLSETLSETATTDSSNTSKEYSPDRITRTLSIERWQHENEDDLALATSKAFVCTVKSGTAFNGDVILNSKSISTSRGSATAINYNGDIQGALTLTNIGELVTSQQSWLLVTGTGKTYGSPTPSINHTSRSISIPVEGEVTVSESFRINAQPTMTKGS